MIWRNICAFVTSARSEVFMIFQTSLVPGSLLLFYLGLSVLSISLLDRVSGVCRCWDMNRLLVDATAAEESLEHAAKLSSSIKLLANQNWLVLCNPVLA